MTGTWHAGLGVLSAVFTAGVLLIRWAVTGGQPTAPRPRRRPVEEWVPAHLLIPAQQLACPDCGTTIHTTTGD
ncbi:hypothetical protein ACWD25_15365 [Streptomyces sp. NPDC002920]